MTLHHKPVKPVWPIALFVIPQSVHNAQQDLHCLALNSNV